MYSFDTKPWWMSKGVLGGLVATGASVGGLFGLKIDAEAQGQILNLADHAWAVAAFGSTFVSGLVAVWGRMTAKQAIR